MKSAVNLTGKRVFVGLSGGVDSALTAALIKEAGALVTGVFIKGSYPEGMPCTWAADRRDAMRVAARLQIPFHTLDASGEYEIAVLNYLIREYAAGQTPNPDIMCNREVKFGAFYRFALAHGADYIATGHYAETAQGKLFRGLDEAKDQSYFLWAVPREVFSKTIFPLGRLHKSETRREAKRRGLPVAEKEDSQGICFLGPVSVEDYLRSRIPVTEGLAVDSSGKEIGTHGGAVLSTLGQRVSLLNAPPGPWFVLAKDLRTNTLVVGPTPIQEKAIEGLVLREVNYVGSIESTEEIDAQYRYHGPIIRGRFDKDTTTFIPSTDIHEPIASGQSLVLYRGSECLGGGIIGPA